VEGEAAADEAAFDGWFGIRFCDRECPVHASPLRIAGWTMSQRKRL
jgi:hypothetical protein